MAIQLTSDDIRSLAILGAVGALGAPVRNVARSGSAGILGAVGGGGADNAPLDIRRYEADEYPTRFSPGKYHTYDVSYIPGDEANMNSVGSLYKDTIKKAGRMQTLDEHNNALLKYLRVAKKDPVSQHRALMEGEEAEKNLPQFWDESAAEVNQNRAQFGVSSSAVSGIRLTPDARIEVQWGTSPKWYTFKSFPNTYEASLEVQKLLMAPSIGQAVMPYQRNGKPIKFKNKSIDYSWWNKPNYDGAFA